MKILLTGASGLVGSTFARTAAADRHQVLGLVGRFSGKIDGLADQRAVNLADFGALEDIFAAFGPDVVVNAAALSEPYQCDADPSGSERINVLLPERLATLARGGAVRFIHLSSEQVFDGTRAPYRCSDPVSPISLYGRQKVASEQRVEVAAGNLAVTVRLPLLMGNSATGRRSVHERLFAEWMTGRTPRLFVDERRQACTAGSVSRAVLELCVRPEVSGVVHWGGAESSSRFQQGQRIREQFGLSDISAPIHRIARADDPELASRRQPDLSLVLAPLDTLLESRPETLAEQVSTLAVPAWAETWYRQHLSR